MEWFTNCAWVLAHKALIANHFMSGAPPYEIKDEPQSGDGCEADAFMNGGAELLRTVHYYDCTFSFRLKYKNPIIAKPIPMNIFEALVW